MTDTEAVRRAIAGWALRHPDPVILTTADLTAPGPRIVFVNEAFTALTGHSVDEVVGMTTRILQGPKTDQAVLDRLRRELDACRAFKGELINYRADGTHFLVDWAISAIDDEAGEVAYWVAVLRELAAHRGAEKTAEPNRDLDAQARVIADSLPALIAYVDRDKRYRFTNRTYEKWLGLARDTIRDRPVRDVLDPPTYAGIDRWLDQVLAGKKVTFENRTSSPTGARFVLVNYVPDIDDGGHVRGAFVIVTDITDRKANEDAVRRAKQDAERASAAKSRFLAAASHDLRQPLQTLRLLLSLLRDTDDKRERDRLIDDMNTAATMADDLLGALLDISQLDAGALTPIRLDFSVEALLRRVERSHRQRAAEQGLSLRVLSCGCVVRSDLVLLGRILDNLVANAIECTESGTILVGCRRRADSISIAVCDTGVGIRGDEVDAIFEEFYRAKSVLRDRRKGLGLGLAIVQRIARMLGHKITVSSTPGKGSIFSVEVPRGDLRRAKQEEDRVDALTGGQIRGRTVMVIEDDDDVLHSMTRLLEHWGATVTPARCLADAAEHASADAMDLIISDYRLPDAGGGVADLKRVQGMLPGRPPIIVVTGDTGVAALQDIESSGCPCLHKPVSVPKLRRQIESSLRTPPA